MSDAPRTFACPSCKEFINDSMKECRFCGAPVDSTIAHALADVQAKVNQACSDGSVLKHTALVMIACLGLSFVPCIPFVFWVAGLTFLFLPFLLLRWQIKFSNLVTNDPDYGKARRSKNIALLFWVLALPLGFIRLFLFEFLLALSS